MIWPVSALSAAVHWPFVGVGSHTGFGDLMRKRPLLAHGNQSVGVSRRAFVTGAAAAGCALGASAAFGQDALLQSLIDQTQRGDFGQGFDSASRTIAMPKASLPTLSPATAEHTGQAIAHYEGIVSRGGWPEVPKIDRLRLGARNPSVVALRQRLTLAGDLDPNAGVSDVYDSYVDVAVRRFQARHGLAVDGNIREQTLKQLNVPAQVRLAQIAHQRGAAQSNERQSRRSLRGLQRSGRAHRGDRRRRRRIAPHGRGRQAGPRFAGHQQPYRRDQLQSVLDRAGLDRAPRSHSQDAGGARLSGKEPHPHYRQGR